MRLQASGFRLRLASGSGFRFEGVTSVFGDKADARPSVAVDTVNVLKVKA